MNNHRTRMSPTAMRAAVLVASLALAGFSAQDAVAAKAKAKPTSKTRTVSAPPCSTTQTAPLINVPLGKSIVLKLQSPASRIILGNPGGTRAAEPVTVPSHEFTGPGGGKEERPAALSNNTIADVDVLLLNPTEIYLLGKSVGSTNLIVVNRAGLCTIMDIAVGIDTKTLESRLSQFLPGSAIKVTAAADSIVLSGQVADATMVDRAMAIASAFTGKGGDSSKVVNMLTVADPQQVMLEVKVAEVSKTLVDKLGAKFNMPRINGSWTYSILTDFLTQSGGVLKAANAAGNKLIQLDAEKKDGLIKILAEPNIMAISGQEGSFLAGGRILVPVPQSSGTGIAAGNTITLEEKEFGVALKFTPTVLANGRINLKVRPEVSELAPEGVTVTEYGGANPSVLPLINTRKAETTVQLNDGQSFAIGGLVKNNVTQNIKAFPILGELPIIGALFRSSDFQTDKSELMFVVTPHIVKPLPPDYPLPTDSFVPPSRAEFFLGGKMEGTPPQSSQGTPANSGANPPTAPSATSAPAAPAGAAQPAASGFELK
jgi:pilus assembly protein CpaC